MGLLEATVAHVRDNGLDELPMTRDELAALAGEVLNSPDVEWKRGDPRRPAEFSAALQVGGREVPLLLKSETDR